MCCICSILYRPSVMFVLLNVLAKLFQIVDAVVVMSFYIAAC